MCKTMFMKNYQISQDLPKKLDAVFGSAKLNRSPEGNTMQPESGSTRTKKDKVGVGGPGHNKKTIKVESRISYRSPDTDEGKNGGG